MADDAPKRADRNKTRLVGWHPPEDVLAWIDAEIERRGGGRGAQSEILTEALRERMERSQ